MDLRICPKGHNYNGDVNATCPICEAEKRGSMVADYGATEPLSGGFGGGAGATEPVTGGFGGGFGEEIGATEPVSGGFGGGFAGGVGPTKPVDEDFGGGFGRGVGTTEPVSNTGFGSSSDTLPPTPSAAFKNSDETMRFDENWAPGVDNYNDQTMPHNPGMVAGFTPVVGWLVCIDGADKGHGYRIRSGYNHIGRAEHMDICIRGDKQISREKHAIIAYDDTEKIFFFGPSDGRNIVRINGKMVMIPTELNPYDILTVGTSRLIFVPLCGDKFDWSN